MPSICLITTVHSPLDSRIFYKIACSLARAGYAVTVLGPDAPDTTIDGVRLKPLPAKPPARFAWKRWFRLPRVWWRARAEHADLYIIHDPELTPVGLLLKLGRRRVIYDVIEHTPYQILDKEWIPQPLRRPVSWLFDRWEKLAARFFDALLPNFEQIADRFAHVKHKVVIIRNVPEVERWTPAHPGERNADGQVIAIYAGSAQSDRCILELVQAANAVDPALNLHLWVIGPFATPDYEAEVRAAAGERVKIFGYIRHDQVPELMSQAHIGLMSLRLGPNSSVNWPIKLFEYMVTGLPMIMHHNPFWMTLADGCALPVNIEDPADIARGLTDLARDDARRAAMGAQGRQLVLNQYNWASQETALLALVDRLIGPPQVR